MHVRVYTRLTYTNKMNVHACTYKCMHHARRSLSLNYYCEREEEREDRDEREEEEDAEKECSRSVSCSSCMYEYAYCSGERHISSTFIELLLL